MPWTYRVLLQLDPADEALNDWQAQLYDPAGSAVGSPITSGFVTLAPRLRQWTAELADGQRGSVRIVSASVAAAEYPATITDVDEMDQPLHEGTSRAWGGSLVATGTVQLATTASAATGAYLTHVLEILTGNLAGQRFPIINFNPANQIVTLSRSWPGVLPDTSTFSYRILRTTSPSLSGGGNTSTVSSQSDVIVSAIVEGVNDARTQITLSSGTAGIIPPIRRTMRYTFGANRGFNEVITGWDANTRTATLANPLPNAPGIGVDQISITYNDLPSVPTPNQVAEAVWQWAQRSLSATARQELAEELATVLAAEHGSGNWESGPAVAAITAAQGVISAEINDGVTLTTAGRDAVAATTWGHPSRTLSSLGVAATEIVTGVVNALSGRTISILSPLQAGGHLRLVAGDDYQAVDQLSLDWPLATSLPDMTGSVVRLLIAQDDLVFGPFAGSVVTVAGQRLARVELAAAATTAIPPGEYDYQIEVSRGPRKLTVVEGLCFVTGRIRPAAGA